MTGENDESFRSTRIRHRQSTISGAHRSCASNPPPLHISLLALASTAAAQWNPLNPVRSEEKQPDGVLLRMQTGLLRLQVCSASIVRILYTPTSSFPKLEHYAVIKTSWPATQFSVDSAGKDVTLGTSQLKVTVTRKDGTIVFRDSRDNKLMESSGRTMSPVVVNGERTYRAEEFVNTWGSPEGFFGLGQHQAGVWNYRGESVDISQDNSNISIPMLLSTNGYGLFWDNPSRSRFNNRFMQSLYISSEVAEQIDYYFIYGPEFDKIVGRLPRADRRRTALRQMGLWLLAVQEPLPVAAGTARRGAQIPRAAHPRRQHRAGLVLVEDHGRF